MLIMIVIMLIIIPTKNPLVILLNIVPWWSRKCDMMWRMMTWWHDDMTLPWSLITILRLFSKVYRLKCLKFYPAPPTSIIDAVMTLLTVISMITKMTISDDTYPRYMIHDQWWWYMMAIHDHIWYMIYDIWYMIYDIWWYTFYVL